MLAVVLLSTPLAAPAFARTKPKPRPVATVAPQPAHPPGAGENPLPAPLGVQAGILVDPGNGNVLWSINGTAARAPASLTKILTALVVLQHADLAKTTVISQDAADVEPSKLWVPAGTAMSIGDLLWGLLLSSGNDAALALAYGVSPDGTLAGFSNLMNQEAATLGATSSHFTDPHGLDAPGHFSSARDLALFTMVAMKNPTFATMVGTVDHTLTWDGVAHPLVNHNRLLTAFPGTIGVKTGFTTDAGSSLASEVTRNGTTLLAVVLGTQSAAGYADSEALYNWGFANLATLESRATERIVPNAPPAAPSKGPVVQAPAQAPARAAAPPVVPVPAPAAAAAGVPAPHPRAAPAGPQATRAAVLTPARTATGPLVGVVLTAASWRVGDQVLNRVLAVLFLLYVLGWIAWRSRRLVGSLLGQGAGQEV